MPLCSDSTDLHINDDASGFFLTCWIGVVPVFTFVALTFLYSFKIKIIRLSFCLMSHYGNWMNCRVHFFKLLEKGIPASSTLSLRSIVVTRIRNSTSSTFFSTVVTLPSANSSAVKTGIQPAHDQ